MFVKEYYAVCDFCSKRVLLPWCSSISTTSVKKLRNEYHWLVCRNGCFVCPDCQKLAIFPIDWDKLFGITERFKEVYSNFLLQDSDFGCEVDIPEFMQKDNVVKFERRNDEV